MSISIITRSYSLIARAKRAPLSSFTPPLSTSTIPVRYFGFRGFHGFHGSTTPFGLRAPEPSQLPQKFWKIFQRRARAGTLPSAWGRGRAARTPSVVAGVSHPLERVWNLLDIKAFLLALCGIRSSRSVITDSRRARAYFRHACPFTKYVSISDTGLLDRTARPF